MFKLSLQLPFHSRGSKIMATIYETDTHAGAAGAGTATTTTAGTVKQAVVQNAAAAADTAALKTQFDALLVKLKNAGLMASA
jgi:hypothetical protein